MGASIRGVNRARSGLRTVAEEIDFGVDEAVDEIVGTLVDWISADTRVDTGNLLRSVRQLDGEVLVGDNVAFYAPFVEDYDPFVAPNVQRMEREGNRIVTRILDEEIR